MAARYPAPAQIEGGSMSAPFSIHMWRARVPGGGATALPLIAVTTVSNEEVERRDAAGECGFDVIDDHTTWLWFSDRDSFRFAWRLARMTARGQRFDRIQPRVLAFFNHRPDGLAAVIANVSRHHIGDWQTQFFDLPLAIEAARRARARRAILVKGLDQLNNLGQGEPRTMLLGRVGRVDLGRDHVCSICSDIADSTIGDHDV